MDALAPYTIPFKGLKNGTHQFDYQIDNSFFDSFEYSYINEGNLDVTFVMEKKTAMLVLNFSFEGTVRTECDRCLEYFDMPLSGNQALIVKFSDVAHEESEEVVYLPTEASELNVAHYIYEMILLHLPMRKACEETDEGLPSCGNEEVAARLNSSNYSLDDRDADDDDGSPWSALKDININ